MLSHEAQCDGIVAVGHDAVYCVFHNKYWFGKGLNFNG